MKAFLENKAKAIAGAIITAIVGYVALAFQQGTALTLHGLEAAAVGAVVGFLGVHQAPKNKPQRKAGDAGVTAIEALVIVILALVALAILFGFMDHHWH